MFKLLSVSFQNQWSRMFIFVITSWQLFLFRINEAQCLFLLSPDNCFFSELMKPNVYFCYHLLTIVSCQNQWSSMFIFVITSWQLFLFSINEAQCLFLLSPPDNCFFSESMKPNVFLLSPPDNCFLSESVKPNVYFCCHLLTIVSFQNQWSRMFIFVITSWQLFLFRINEAECLFLLSPPDNNNKEQAVSMKIVFYK
jgi:putative component of membrane protein insertase Oxa1/YidC/SpoIIIJ protein YidD